MRVETDYDIGDVFCVADCWKAVCTAITIRASGQVEYQLEWVGDAGFNSEWFTRERIELLGLKRISTVGNKVYDLAVECVEELKPNKKGELND